MAEEKKTRMTSTPHVRLAGAALVVAAVWSVGRLMMMPNWVFRSRRVTMAETEPVPRMRSPSLP